MGRKISKEDLFNKLADEEIFPTTNGHENAVRRTIFDFLGTSEEKAPNGLVDQVYKAAKTYHDKSTVHWRKNNYNKDTFKNNLTKPRRFLSNCISISGR